ncbi:hypothetical protein DL766_005199 [Monosporascus sp. MC13-8B]|uniref:Uncharacterized protein n=1 Tax=Monosporascus cannonballus TaxID=155416 RepID=A0ABY0HEM7_9PEZI|nr:hypothetical protein DL762_003567 [Monosporascus cannonballus]RYO98172.1 hypothetical protein DL763_002413 [Monosporascus cannonballus]RYP29834.1 hypothetical protein DL766_005199 [Monosporascus sp. MC13-8B]
MELTTEAGAAFDMQHWTVKPEALCNAIKAISREMAMTLMYGMPYLRKLKPTNKLTLTSHGMELILASKGKATYDLEAEGGGQALTDEAAENRL